MIIALRVRDADRGACAAAPAADAEADAPTSRRLWLVLGGTSTTLRGDCQEDCVAHGTGDYLHTGSVLAMVGARVNRKMDVGAEVSWVPATAKAGADVRSTFLLAAAQFRPWESHGFFLKGGMGMAFVRNFVYDGTGTLPPITSKALGLSYAAGWAFRRSRSRRLPDVRRAARGRARRLPDRRGHRRRTSSPTSGRSAPPSSSGSCRAVALALLLVPACASAQELEPGAYWPIPKGLNIVTAANSFNWGDLAFDPSAPIDEASATINTTAVALTGAFSLAGRSANAGIGGARDRWSCGRPIFG